MRRLRYAGWALAGLLAACAAQPGGDPGAGSGGPRSAGTPVDPVELIGIWAVEEAAGAGDGVIRLAPGGLTLWVDCGYLSGAWDANTAGMFVSYVTASGQGCEPGQAPEWLSRAVAFQPGDADVALRDRDGEVAARLRPGATPPPGVPPSQAKPPPVTDEVRDRYAPAAELPDGLVPADSGTLHGRWRPADRPGSAAYLQLDPDGSWQGSDGCNAVGGRWAAGHGGLLVAVSGASTLVGCDNVPVAGWLADAARAGLAGEDLVLVSVSGAEIARLRPAG